MKTCIYVLGAYKKPLPETFINAPKILATAWWEKNDINQFLIMDIYFNFNLPTI